LTNERNDVAVEERAENGVEDGMPAGGENGASNITRPRTMTTTDEIDSTIIRPGAVRINVKGAFIVDPESMTPAQLTSNGGQGSPTHHETRDIRLPNHTAVVSHVAIDVILPPPCVYLLFRFVTS